MLALIRSSILIFTNVRMAQILDAKTPKNNIRTQTLGQTFKDTFTEFRDTSSIHGVKYMFASKEPLWSRILWTSSFSIALFCCTSMCMHSLWEFHMYPIMHSKEAYHHQLSSYPFPAVTICNVNRFQSSRARQFVDSLRIPGSSSGNITRTSIQDALPHLAALASADISDIGVSTDIGNTLQDVLDFNKLSIKDAFEQLYQPCTQLLERCRWDGHFIACAKLFEPRLTYQGYCCSFNYAINRRQNLRQSRHSGVGEGLTLLLNVASHDVLPGTAVALGAKVILHRNTDFPGIGAEGARCGMGNEWLINVKSQENYHEDTLRTLSTAQRQCVFEDETQHMYTGLPYSAPNCKLVCRADKSYRLCGCVAFYVPNTIARGRRVCDLRDLPCRFDNRIELETSWDCACYPKCTYLQYFHRIHSGDFGATGFHHDIFYENANLTDRTVVHTYFGTQLMKRSKASISKSVHALMALFGGYCSLFLGCSLISCWEIIYFSTIRIGRQLLSKT